MHSGSVALRARGLLKLPAGDACWKNFDGDRPDTVLNAVPVQADPAYTEVFSKAPSVALLATTEIVYVNGTELLLRTVNGADTVLPGAMPVLDNDVSVTLSAPGAVSPIVMSIVPVVKVPDVAVDVSDHAARVPTAPRPRTMPIDMMARARALITAAPTRDTTLRFSV